MSGPAEWSPARVQQLRDLWDQKLSVRKIAARLNTTANAIVGKAHRLKLTGRESPIKRGGEPKAERATKAPRTTLPPLDSERVHPAAAKAQWRDEVVRMKGVFNWGTRGVLAEYLEPDVNEDRRSVAILVGNARKEAAPRRAARGDCCWPIGEPNTPSFRYCDAPAKRGSYCAEHARIAYLSAKVA